MGVLDPSWPQGGALVLMRIHAGARVSQGTWVLVFTPAFSIPLWVFVISLTLAACFDSGRVISRPSL